MWPEVRPTQGHRPQPSTFCICNARQIRYFSNFVSIVILSFSLFPFVSTFNVDVGTRVVHTPPNGSCDNDCMFGFAVAQHRDQGTPWLLVGAPEAESGQPNIRKGGAVYRCPPDAPGRCELIEFDSKGNNFGPQGQQLDKKSGQWFGALVKSSGDNGVILACAPRYIWFSRNYKRREPVGTCYFAKNNFAQFIEYSPCRTSPLADYYHGLVEPIVVENQWDFVELVAKDKPVQKFYMVCDFSKWNNLSQVSKMDHCLVYERSKNGSVLEVGKWGYHRQGSCQAGLGADIAKDGNQVFVGAVGSFYWQGQVYSQKLLSPNEQHKTGEGSPSDDDSYLGYSVTTGDFDGDGDKTDVAVGMPRGTNLTGTIVIYNANLTNLFNISGDQIGAYFGYSVASGDFNGDGLDDLVIGSPMWTNYEIMGKYETGMVTIAYQKPKQQFRQRDFIEGMNHKARFGLSVACAGNINLDGISQMNKRGYEDLIVGAPYDGPDGHGAVYIFLGSSDGLQKAPAQVIFGRDVDNTIRTFGWSLSGGMDLDNNEYPDLLVGAYESTSAVYLRSAPVVHLDSKVSFLVGSKQINLDTKTCSLSDRTQVPCVEVKVELFYSGVGVPNTVDLNLQYILDVKKENTKRLFFLKQEGTTSVNKSVTIKKEKPWSETFKVYLPASGIQDKLTSLDIQVKCLLNTRGSSSSLNFRSPRSLSPVLGHDERSASDSISIQKNCGKDNDCIPNLSLDVSHIPNYIMGSGERLEITVDIKNTGEDAFNAIFYLQIPRGINYFNANSSLGICSAPNPGNNRTIQCDVGNPLPANSKVTVRVFLQPIEQDQDDYLREYMFFLSANSSNPETDFDLEDNHLEIRIPVTVTAELRLSGTARPNPVEYNITAPIIDKFSVEDEIGQEIYHVYELKNRGPSTILETEVYILWPSLDDSKNHLLYLLGFSHEGTASVTCEQIPNLNPLYIKVNGSRGYAEAYTQAEAQGHHFYGRSDVSVGRSATKWATSSTSFSSQLNSYRQTSTGSSSSSSNSFTRDGSKQSGTKQTGTDSGHYQTSYEYDNRFKGGSAKNVDVSKTRTNYGRTQVDSSNENRAVDVENDYEDNDLLSNQQQGSSSSSISSSHTEYGRGESKTSYDRGSNYESTNNGVRTSTPTRVQSTSLNQGSRVAQGWSMKEDGTYIRVYNTNTTATVDEDPFERSSSGSRSGSRNDGLQSSGSSSGRDNYSGSSKSDHSLNTILGAARGPGDYHGTMKKSELEKDAGGRVFSSSGKSTSSQVERTRYQGQVPRTGSQANSGGSSRAQSFSYETSNENELDYQYGETNDRKSQSGSSNNFGSQGSLERNSNNYGSGSSANGGGSVHYEQGSYYDQSNRGRYSSGGSGSSSQSSSSQNSIVQGGSTTTKCNYVWSEENGRWECEPSNHPVEQGSRSNSQGGRARGQQERRKGQNRQEYFSSGHLGQGDHQSNSGQFDSGWVDQGNGSYIRRQSTWTQRQRESSVGGVQLNSDDYEDEISPPAPQDSNEVLDNEASEEEQPRESGDHGKNSTGWVRRPDGTMIRKSSSWASWSAVSTSDDDSFGKDQLQTVRKRLEKKTNDLLRQNDELLPENVEPGYEASYINRQQKSAQLRRFKRAYPDFERDISCPQPGCTRIKCMIGPLQKDDNVVLKVRSRLFTQTLIKSHSESIVIPSKLVARVTRLPFQADPMTIEHQTIQVLTNVFPSERGEAQIPWWVWLLAALGGLLLLAFISYCLYKCGFFKRKRPDNSPERQPLNGYH